MTNEKSIIDVENDIKAKLLKMYGGINPLGAWSTKDGCFLSFMAKHGEIIVRIDTEKLTYTIFKEV